MTNGPESFTPDGRYIFGEAPEVNLSLSLDPSLPVSL